MEIANKQPELGQVPEESLEKVSGGSRSGGIVRVTYRCETCKFERTYSEYWQGEMLEASKEDHRQFGPRCSKIDMKVFESGW